MAEKEEYLSMAEYGRRAKVTKQYISYLVKNDMLPYFKGGIPSSAKLPEHRKRGPKPKELK